LQEHAIQPQEHGEAISLGVEDVEEAFRRARTSAITRRCTAGRPVERLAEEQGVMAPFPTATLPVWVEAVLRSAMRRGRDRRHRLRGS
jgi:hypothetical protein